MTGSLASILALVAGFLLGSLAFGYWWGRVFRGIDVREHGSRNLGATNVFRTLGPVHGILVLILDIAKGAAAVIVARQLVESETVAVIAGLFAVLGHIMSPWVGFRGGKGAAAGLGAWLILAPSATGIALLAFLLAVGLSRRISVGSLTGATVLLPAVYFLSSREGLDARFILAILTVGLVWLRHRSNLARLLKGTERPLWGKGS